MRAATEALRALRTVEVAVAERYPGSLRDHPLAGNPDAPAGLVVRHGEAVTLVGPDLRGEGSGEWPLQATCVMALGGGDIDGGLEWVNARNRNLAVGKYFSAHSRQAGMAAIAYDTWIQGVAFLACADAGGDGAGGRLAGVLLAMVANVIDTGAADAADAIAAINGRPPTDSPEDLQALLVIALG